MTWPWPSSYCSPSSPPDSGYMLVLSFVLWVLDNLVDDPRLHEQSPGELAIAVMVVVELEEHGASGVGPLLGPVARIQRVQGNVGYDLIPGACTVEYPLDSVLHLTRRAVAFVVLEIVRIAHALRAYAVLDGREHKDLGLVATFVAVEGRVDPRGIGLDEWRGITVGEGVVYSLAFQKREDSLAKCRIPTPDEIVALLILAVGVRLPQVCLQREEPSVSFTRIGVSGGNVPSKQLSLTPQQSTYGEKNGSAVLFCSNKKSRVIVVDGSYHSASVKCGGYDLERFAIFVDPHLLAVSPLIQNTGRSA